VSTRDLEKIQAARVWAVRQMPYLAIALHSLQVRWVEGYGTFGVDRHWRMYVDPAALDRWTVEEVGGVLLHEVWHLLREHHSRAERLGDGLDARRWNLAADAEINDDLVEGGTKLPSPVLPSHFGQPNGRMAEEYYEHAPETEQCDCGSGADAVERGHEDGDPSDESPGLSRTQGDLVRTTCAQEIAEASRLRGDVPSGWARWADARLTPKVDWRAVLASQVRRAVATAAGAVDYSWSRPSRRQVPGVVLPSLRRPVPTIAIVIDTSASVDSKMLDQALAEVDGALSSSGTRRNDVTVLSCDAGVGNTQRVRSARDVRLIGGGGTDMRVGIHAAMQLRPRPDVVVVLTDGWTPRAAARDGRRRAARAGCRCSAGVGTCRGLLCVGPTTSTSAPWPTG
jgi:predicted metal-dependent peptidase